MNNDPTAPLTTETISSSAGRAALPSLCWRAILGGTVAAIGIHILLTALGVEAGLATFAPRTDTHPVANFSVGAAIGWTICALVALWFGGVLAGRFSHSLHSGFVHGVLVWSLTLIITILLLSMGTGMVLGGALKVLGEGLGIGGKAVTAGLSDTTKEGVKRGADQLGSFIDEAVQSAPANTAPKDITRAKREIGFAVNKLFAPGNDVASQDNRAATIKALASSAGMSGEDATNAVDGWILSYKKLKTELDNRKKMAEETVREAADRAASNVSCAALWSFFALLIGLLVTALGGSCGATYAVRHADSRLLAVN